MVCPAGRYYEARSLPPAGQSLYPNLLLADKPSCPNRSLVRRLYCVTGWKGVRRGLFSAAVVARSRTGPWPLDHYALLDLSPGLCEQASVERVVLARMDRLRSHQLLHPELVTEGMNRLAQALICLTDPVARVAYDAELGLNPSLSATSNKPVFSGTIPQPLPPPTIESVPDLTLTLEDSEPNGTDVTQVIDVRYVPGLAPPEPLPPAYELVEGETPEPLPPAYEVVWGAEARPSAPAFEVVETKVVVPPPLPSWQPRTRRALFRRLAAIRQLLPVWRKLKPLLGNPREPIDRPVLALTLLEAVAEVRPHLDSLAGFVGKHTQAGGLVTALLRQPLLLHTIRALLPDQRHAIAADWQRAEYELIREYSRLRELARSGRPLHQGSRTRPRLRKFARWVGRTPEAILLALATATLISAILRGYLER